MEFSHRLAPLSLSHYRHYTAIIYIHRATAGTASLVQNHFLLVDLQLFFLSLTDQEKCAIDLHLPDAPKSSST
uniref:Uncharacterized protein n=1 Tax=Heterorhabditis bacteriophora TaxID=37862 RepID=A0A1I7X0K9_HETBA